MVTAFKNLGELKLYLGINTKLLTITNFIIRKLILKLKQLAELINGAKCMTDVAPLI